MVINATLNNILVISWRSVLLVEEAIDLSQVTDKLYHIMLYFAWTRFELATLVVIDSDCIGSYKSKYHTSTTTTAPLLIFLRRGDARLQYLKYLFILKWYIQFWLVCNAMNFYTIVLYFNNIYIRSLLLFECCVS